MTVEQFGKALIASGLMTADDVKAIWNGLPADARPKTDFEFGKLLVEKSLLTPFQVAEIIAGRGARLVMGDYTIVAQIGAGGMGQVYKAQHKRMKRTVALKVMSNAAMQDEAAVKRFQREVHAAAKLEHPNIVTAYDSGESGNVKYLVMQFVDGGDLSDLVKKGGRLPIEQAVGYVIQAARGLAFAHGEGVIHRDIKPANLLLDKKGVVKILDMGLARFEDGGDGLTATEQVMGTVDYMSPEQAANTKGCDGRADIYSLGCTLWYLLTGKKLYEADTLIARLMAHRDGPLPSLVKERDDAPWPLEQALHKMIAKRAADRYQTMDEAIAALAPYGGASAGGTGGGSSPSMGQSAELASFMQAMGTGGGTKTNISATQVKPATSANVDATAQFTSPEVGTDPKSQVLPKAATTKPQTQTKKSKAGNNKTKMIAAGAVGILLLLAGIIIKVLNKDGEVVAEIKVPEGGSVQVLSRPANPVSAPPNGDGRAETPTVALTPGEILTSFHYSWSTPVNLGAPVNGLGDQNVLSLTGDQLRLFFDFKTGADGRRRELREAVRTSLSNSFSVPRTVSTGAEEAFVSYDGLSFVGGTSWPTYNRRSSLDAPFIATDDLITLKNNNVNGSSPTLSPDGLTLVFNSKQDQATEKTNLYISKRRSIAEAFGPAIKLGPAINSQGYEHRGFLLGDGKTFVFLREDWYATKTNPDGSTIAVPLYGHPFGSTRNVWFAPDGSTAYFSADLPGGAGGQDIYVTHRKPIGGAASSTPANAASAPPSFISSTISQTPAPPGDYALLLDRDSSVTAPNPQLDESQPFTVEAYITPGDAAAIDLVNQRILGVHGEFHFTLIDGRWRFYSTHDEATSAEKFTPRQRIHIAGVRTATQRLLFIEGKRVAATDEPLGLKKKDDDFPLHIQPMGPVVVTVDEVRVSQGVVYDKPFTPPAKLTADANTLALYHFDEGFGDVLKDSSGKGRDGKIIGAKWVKADGSPIPTTGIPSSTTLTPASPTTPIPAEALTFGGHRYLLVDSFCTWSEAKAKAEALGGHLATVNGKEERDWILTNIFRNRPRADESDRVRQVRLGGYIAGPGDRWSWITGEPFDESLWLGAMPTVIEQCGLCWTADGKWNNSPTDSDNARSFYFLVEWDTLSPQNASITPTPIAPTSQPAGASPAATASAAVRWPLAPTKPEEIAWLKSLRTRLTLRNGAPVDRTSPTTETTAPPGDWTVVGVELHRDNGAAIDDAAFGRICTLVDLESLHCEFGMPGARVTKKGFEQLKRLTNLRHLQIARLSPPDSDPAVLTAFPNLESLGLMNSPLVGWEPYVAKLANLRELTLYNSNEANLKQLGAMPRLTKLRFAGYQNHHPIRLAAAQPFIAANPWCRVQFVGLDGDNMKELFIEPTAPAPGAGAVPPSPTGEDQASVAKWLFDNKKLARIGFEIDGKRVGLSTLPTGPYKVVDLNFSKFNNAGQPLTDAEVARLAVFTDLESLELLAPELTDAGFARLAPLTKLKVLIVADTSLTPASVATIRRFPQLETLHGFTGDEWLKSLAGMPTLRSMTFWKDNVSPQAMNWFPQYPNLNELRFHDCFETPDVQLSLALAPLKDCKSLTKLYLNSDKIDADALAVLSGLTGLIELDLFSSKVSEAQLKQLTAALPRCRIKWKDPANNFKQHIFEPTVPPATAAGALPATAIEQWIKETSTKPAAAQLEAVSKKLIEFNPGFDGKLTGTRTGSPPTIENGVVTSLRVNGSTITDLAPLRALTGLVELDFGGPSAAKGKFTDLSSLRGMQLKSLILSGMGAEITDLTPLAGMPLEYLSCRELRKLTDLGPIAGMSKLKHLDFLYTGVADLAKVQGLQALEVLILPKSITDISPLKSLKLEHLQCNQIASLEPLRGMPLKTLWFSSESLTDFSPLYELKDLEHVRIINAKLPEGFQASLQKALPNCRIDLK